MTRPHTDALRVCLSLALALWTFGPLLACDDEQAPPAGTDTAADLPSDPSGDPGVDAAGDLTEGDSPSDATPLIPRDCPYGEVCFVPVEGMVCGDGSPTGISVRYVEGASNLLIFFESGGACWNQPTCESFVAQRHYAQAEAYSGSWSSSPWASSGWFADPEIPFTEGYDMAFLHYCTGDAWAGDNTIDYGSPDAPFVQHHRGFPNVRAALENIHQRWPAPSVLVLAGLSAGGYGVLWNLRQLVEEYGESAVTLAINDAGLPMQPPFFPALAGMDIGAKWNLAATVPDGLTPEAGAISFGDMVRYNRETFPTIRQAFISYYSDIVKDFFFCAGRGLQDPTREWECLCPEFYEPGLHNIMKVALVDIGVAVEHYAVFYVEGEGHTTSGCWCSSDRTITCETGECTGPFLASDVVVGDWTLAEWLTAMESGDRTWQSVHARPWPQSNAIHRGRRSADGSHTYTPILQDLTCAATGNELETESYFWLSATPSAGHEAVYRHVSLTDFSTVQVSTEASLEGWLNDGIIGWIATAEADDTVAVSALVKGDDHVLTVSPDERADLLSDGYADSGTLGYAYVCEAPPCGQ